MAVPGHQRHEVRELRAISLYLCDRVREVLADGMHSCVIWPCEVLAPLVTKLTQEVLWLFDSLSEGYNHEHCRFARAQLGADLRCLSKYFSAWNESKRVVFDDGSGELPGRAVVASVDYQKLNQYVTQQLQEHTIFANTYINFYTRLRHPNKEKVERLFRFDGQRFDAIKDRTEHKLWGQQDALGEFEITHKVLVRQVAVEKDRHYRVYSTTKPQSDLEVEKVYVSARSLAKRAGFSLSAAEAAFSTAQHCEEIRAIRLPVPNYMCDVMMRVRHTADAHVWVHPLTGVLSFGVISAFNHSRQFEGSAYAMFHMAIPMESVKPAYVSVPASSLLDLLMGNPTVRLQCGPKWIGV